MKLYLAAAVLMLVLAVQTGKIVHLIHLLRYTNCYFILKIKYSQLQDMLNNSCYLTSVQMRSMHLQRFPDI